MKSVKRLAYLDYARVFVAYLVIFGHLLPMDNHMPRDIIYTFHMPFFFLVSGMLHKLTDSIQWRKYLCTIGIPLLSFNILYFFVVNPLYIKLGVYESPVDSNYWQLLNSSLARLWNGLFFNGNIPSGVTWFLVALLWCKLLMDFIHQYKIIGGGVFAILFVLIIATKFPSLYLRNAMMVFPFYYVGCHYKSKIEWITHTPYAFIYSFLCLMVLLGIVFLNGKVSTKGVNFGHCPYHLNFLLFYAGAFVGSLMMLFIASPMKENRIITYLATSLITILGMQAIFCDPYRCYIEPLRYELMIPIAIMILFACSGIHLIIIQHAPFFIGKTK